MFNYLENKDIDYVFDLVKKYYAHIEEVPDFRSYIDGVSRFIGVLEGVKSDEFYPTIQDKAAYLFVQINKGHFFPNGNKRLALTTALSFLAFNNFRLKDSSTHKTYTKEYVKKLFLESFSEKFPYVDYDDFTPDQIVLYNLSILVAESGLYIKDFQELKQKVTYFFREIIFDYATFDL